MSYIQVDIDTAPIIDWASFHRVFAEAFGFPDFYGGNMDAWIDCLSALDVPEEGMTTVHAPEGGVVVLELSNTRDFSMRCAEIYLALIEGAALVNHRRLEMALPPVLCLSFQY